MSELWEELVSEALDEVGANDKLTREQLAEFAVKLRRSAEMLSDNGPPPAPANTVAEKQEQSVNALKNERDAYRKELARVLQVRVEDLYVHGVAAMVRR